MYLFFHEKSEKLIKSIRSAGQITCTRSTNQKWEKSHYIASTALTPSRHESIPRSRANEFAGACIAALSVSAFYLIHLLNNWAGKLNSAELTRANASRKKKPPSSASCDWLPESGFCNQPATRKIVHANTHTLKSRGKDEIERGNAFQSAKSVDGDLKFHI